MLLNAAIMEQPPALRAAFSPMRDSGREADPANSFEASRDRILITLRALNLMLMAFFVVLNSTATLDSTRSAEVARSMPANAAANTIAIENQSPVAPVVAATRGNSARIEASAALRAAVADVFAAILPAGAGITTTEDDGRVDVDVPQSFLSSFVDAGAGLPSAVLDGLAHVMSNPPAGYHTELLINGQGSGDANPLARLAQDLVSRGVISTALSVGMIAKTAGTQSGGLRFTFLLLEPGEDDTARLATPPGLAGRGR